MDYFFYGTLMDGDVLAAVIGRRVPGAAFEPARIEGYRRVYRQGAWYPILVAEPGGRVDGVLVAGITASEAARLAAFEGAEYRLATAPVRAARSGTVPAHVFLPHANVPAAAEDWTLAGFRRRHRAEYLRRVRRRTAPAP